MDETASPQPGRSPAATTRPLTVHIRPDGHIAFISDAGNVLAVSDHLAAID